ncbi:MAG: F0F1 ATP synthase subunit epsilon [Crocinitomicaceae bacterium]|nr:F0F1 ATP synthase subunit epsilon [Crocinitomicaceae bacterium]
MLLEIITPDELLYKGNVSHVVLPGLDGSFGILNMHAPLISALAKGQVKIDQNVSENSNEDLYNGKLNSKHKNDSSFTFEINGGVIEVKDNKIIVLAE